MKKYIVKYKDGEKTFGEYNSRKEASYKVMEYIYGLNNDLVGDYISPFDFVLEEVECEEVNKVITDFESARKFIGIKSNFDFTVAKKRLSKSVVPIKGVARLVNELNPKHIEALVALNKLFTIAEAWNKAEGFIPDFSDRSQKKWFPWFTYDKYAARFVSACTGHSPAYVNAFLGSRICFKTRERAAQFGKQFEELYNKVFL